MKSNMLFTMNLLNKGEISQYYKEKLEEKGITKMDPEYEKQLEIMLDQYEETMIIPFPPHVGITG